MARHLGAVPADTHVAPSAPAGRGPIDEDLAASVVGTCPQPMRVVLGQEVGERAGDGCPGLVEVVANLGHRVASAALVGDELVVVKAVAQDVVEVTDLLACRAVAVIHALRDGVDQVAQVAKALEPPLGLRGIAGQALRLPSSSALADQPVLLEPGEQRRRLRNVVSGDAAGVLEGVREAHEELFGLGWFWQKFA